jgi:putative spermidine/putrescine transport system ATP-binding protein
MTDSPASQDDGALRNNRPVAIRFNQVFRHFNDVKAVDGVSLDIYDGEFFSLLGPSGSGKTTCLRLVAGFEHPTAGSIELYGQDVSRVPPYDRDVNTVFQDYALFPHMNIEQNVGYGLLVKGVPTAQRRQRVQEMLELVRLPGLEKRKPSQLSGGQRQRVALARALINHPKVLLLDEPLGALDLKLRQQMQIELKAIQQQVGITFIFVTHDQEEALTMSDRLAVFNLGKIEQVGTPAEIYEKPSTVFVAGFVGTSNLIEGAAAQTLMGQSGIYTIRPEKVRLDSPDVPVSPEFASYPGVVEDVTYLGIYTRYTVLLDAPVSTPLMVVQQNLKSSSQEALAAKGRRVNVVWEKSHMRRLEG